MRFGYVLLGLVTLAFLHVSSGQVCSNWFPGVQTANICCDIGCGTCGGGGCASRPGGRDSCCMGVIEDSGVLCSDSGAAPCIVDNEKKCSNLLIGVENAAGDVCCEDQCEICGGSGCGQRPGGSSSCCMGTIRASGDMCSVTMAAPCVIDDALLCSNGLPGVEEGGICCKAHCETCGGSGCAQRSGGPENCCRGRILDSGVLCSTTDTAPCIIDN